MKFTIERDPLVQTLGRLGKVVPKGAPGSLMGGILLDAANNRLRLSACDMAIWLTQDVGALVATPGRRILDFGTLHDLCRGFPTGSAIEFEMGANERITIRCARSKAVLPSLKDEVWAGVKPLDATPVVVPAQDLTYLLNATGYAASDDPSKPNLRGIYLHVEGTDWCAVGTNVNILVATSVEAPLGHKALSPIILPTQTAEVICDALDGTTDVIGVTIEQKPANVQGDWKPSRISIEAPSFRIDSKLVDATYFTAYRNVIPAIQEFPIEIPVPDLTAAVRRATALGQDYKKSRMIYLTFGQDSLTVSGKSDATFDETLDIACTREIEFAVSGELLSAHLSALSTHGSILMHLSDSPLLPILITVDNEPRASWVLATMKGNHADTNDQ